MPLATHNILTSDPAVRRGAGVVVLAGLVLAMMVVAGALSSRSAIAAVAEGGSCGRSAPTVDPLRLYGEDIEFQVRRNGTPVGSHTVRFARDGGRLRTETRFEIAVNVLFITAYRYVYESKATWRDGCLLSLDAKTDENGDETVVRVSRDGDRLTISGPSGVSSVAASKLPTEHWDAAVLGRNAVINTITGRLSAVDIKQIGTEQVRGASGETISARHFAYTGDLRNEVWYDDDGRWVKMRFSGNDGSTIEYVCVKCAGASTRS